MDDAVTVGAMPAQELTDLGSATMRKVGLRFLPLLMAAYVSSYLDRVNTGFAVLTANKDLGLTPTFYGLGAGLFFVGYFLFEFPSNLMLERVGARRWITRIMLTLGLISAAMALVVGPWSFFVVRFLLGIAEAGLFPGVILFLTYWFPRQYRARSIGWFMLGIPVSSLIGSPISGMLLGLDGVWGLKGWQWLYLIEAVPSIALAGLSWVLLADGPASATWLTPAQRGWLEATLAREQVGRPAHQRMGYLATMMNRRVLLYAALYFNITSASYGLSLWLPQIVNNFGLTDLQTGFVSAIPFAFGSAAMLLWGRHSDRTGERVWHTSICCFIAAAGLGCCILTSSPVLQITALSVGAIGIFGVKGPFLSLLSGAFNGPGAAGGIAMATAIGNLSGFFPPYAVGFIKSTTGSFGLGLLFLAGLAALGGLHVLFVSGSEQDKKGADFMTQIKTCQGPDPDTRAPAERPLAGACDTHCHVFGPQSLFPFAEDRAYTPPDAPIQELQRVHRTLGIDRAVIVQASCHGSDNSAMLAAMTGAQDRYRGIAIVDGHETERDYASLHDGGVRGVRFNFVRHLGGVPDLAFFDRTVDRMRELGWHVVLHLDAEDILTHRQRLDALPIPFVIDHMGRVPTRAGLDQAPFAALLDLMRNPRAWIKICGPERISSAGAPFRDAIPFAQALYRAAPDRTLWGTDWPHPNIARDMPNDGDLVDLLHLALPDHKSRHAVLVDNPHRLYWSDLRRRPS